MLHQEHILLHLKSLPVEKQIQMLAPLYATTIAEIENNRTRYTETGIQAIQKGKVGAVLLAGGQGSRLGFNHPKGMFNVGVN